jgi:hypothetical protein
MSIVQSNILRSQKQLCVVDDCNTPRKYKTWCPKHYLLLRGISCSIEGCNTHVKGRGWCEKHYDRWRAHGDPLKTTYLPPDTPCSIDGCDKLARRRGWCNAHYTRWYKHGDPLKLLTVPREPGKPGLARTNRDGYVLRRFPEHPNSTADGQLLEHVMVMSSMIGRPLCKDETVHHKNGVRNDNRPENLELWSSSQPPGQRVEDKLAWAYEMIKRYAE